MTGSRLGVQFATEQYNSSVTGDEVTATSGLSARHAPWGRVVIISLHLWQCWRFLTLEKHIYIHPYGNRISQY